jgi:hypothetical protein
MEAFDGGLNNKYEPAIIGDNEAQSCANVVFDDLGGVKTREGYTLLNTAAVNSNPCDGLYTAKWNNGNESMIVAFGTDLFVLSGTTFQTIGSAQGNYATGAHKNFVMYQNLVFIGDGSTPAYKYDEGVYTRHGVEVPSLVATGNANGSGGNLIGDYHYKVAFVNTQGVAGNLSTGSVTFIGTAAGESFLVTGIANHDQSFGVNAKWLYRTIAGSGISGTYYFVASLADTATTYADNIASASLGSAANTDAGKPPAYEFAVHHQERLFVNDTQNPQYLWYSDLAEPFTFASTNFIKIADGDGEKITGLGVQGNSLVVFKEASVWLIYMPDTTPSNWIRIRSDAKYGGASHRSIVPYERQLMYLGQHGFKVSGFYAFLGDTTEPDATALRVTQMFGDAKSDRIEPDVFLFQDSYKQNCAAIAFDNKLWFAITHGSAQTTNNRIYHFDYVRRGTSRKIGSWVPFTGIAANDFTVYSSSLYFGTAASDGFVYQLQDGTYTDNGAAIDSYFETKEFDGGSAWRHYDKDFRQANFTVETLGDWDMRVSYRIDSDKGAGDGEDFNLNAGGANWTLTGSETASTLQWTLKADALGLTTEQWGGGQTRKDIKVDLAGSGKRVSFKFTNKNTASSAFKVVRGNLYYNRRGLR